MIHAQQVKSEEVFLRVQAWTGSSDGSEQAKKSCPVLVRTRENEKLFLQLNWAPKLFNIKSLFSPTW